MLLAVLPALAGPPGEMDANVLERELASRSGRVAEFRFIREQAEKLGVRVWLFGGTAAAYAHYVKWDIQREGGDKRFQPDRFDYDYTNIFRSTQDLDIVVDGPAEQARELQKILETKYPHTRGNKSMWEVRPLKDDLGDKEALLKNPDFLNQHTDSNSTGLIELTTPAKNESAIRDLRDWSSKRPQFFEDVRKGTLHYYFSKSHGRTNRARQGLNPPILSVIRYLTKAFQYQLEIPPEDWAVLKKVVDRFDSERDVASSYVANWIEKNGKKLFLNAVSVEYAWDKLEELGLREKLVELGDPSAKDSLAWWLEKEPLRSFPLGQVRKRAKSGATAAELGITEVAHETRDFLAYESITRSHEGVPNVFISRNGAVGEAAVFGDGFYTAMGRRGARGTGITIRFTVDPKARENVDFITAGNFVVFLNRNALKVVPEGASVGPLEFFKMLADFDDTDHGIYEKLRRRIVPKMSDITPEEREKVLRIVRKAADAPDEPRNDFVLQTWLSLKESARHPRLLVKLLDIEGGLSHVAEALKLPHWNLSPQTASLVEPFIDRLTAQGVAYYFKDPAWAKSPLGAALIEQAILKLSADSYVVCQVLSNPEWKQNPRYVELVSLIADRGQADAWLVPAILTDPSWASTKGGGEMVRKLLARDTSASNVIASVLTRPEWAARPDAGELLELAFKAHGGSRVVANFLLGIEAWAKLPAADEAMRKLLASGEADAEIAGHMLKMPRWSADPRFDGIFKTLLERGNVHSILAGSVLPEPGFAAREGAGKTLEKIAADKRSHHALVESVLGKPGWANLKEARTTVQQILALGSNQQGLVSHVFSAPEWQKRPELGKWLRSLMKIPLFVKEMVVSVFPSETFAARKDAVALIKAAIRTGFVDGEIARKVLSQPHWAAHADAPELAELLLKGGKANTELVNYVFNQPIWDERPESWKLVETIIDRDDAIREVAQSVLSRPSWAKHPQGAMLLAKVSRRGWYAGPIMRLVLSNPAWAENPGAAAILKGFLGDNNADQMIEHVLSNPAWAKNPEAMDILLALAGEKDGPKAIAKFVLVKPEWMAHARIGELKAKVAAANTSACLDGVASLRSQ